MNIKAWLGCKALTGNSPRKAYIGGIALPYQCDLRQMYTKHALCSKCKRECKWCKCVYLAK